MSHIYNALKRSNDAVPSRISKSIDAIQSEMSYGTVTESAVSLAEESSPREPHFNAFAQMNPFGVVQVPIPTPAPVFPFNGGNALAAEQYRVLRTNLVHHPARPRVIAISSATPGDGKSTTTINLGGTFALKSDGNVLVIDADLRRCGVSETLQLDATRGLKEVLRGESRLEDAIVRIDQLPNLHVLPAHRTTDNPAELLDSAAWRGMIDALRERFSYILIDTTPVQAVADFKLVEQVVDGVVMVVRPDHTNRAALNRALAVQSESKMLGLVVNAYEDWFLWDTTKSYGYYQ